MRSKRPEEKLVTMHVHEKWTTAKSGKIYGPYYVHRKTGERLPKDAAKRARRVLEINSALTGQQISGSFAQLCDAYQKSAGYNKLAANTRRDYDNWIKRLRPAFANYRVAHMNQEWVQTLQDTYEDTPRAADYAVQVASILFKYACKRSSIYGLQDNPARGIEKLYDAKEGYRQWPEDLIEAFRERAYPELRQIFEGMLYFGQRPGDTCKMPWGRYDGEGVTVVQQKTGKELWVPAHPRMQAILADMPKRGTVIFTTANGKAWKTNWLAREVGRIVRECGYTGYVPHGLCKNAMSRLIEAGCSTAEASAVTGRSGPMVKHYSAAANQKRLAQSAVEKMR